MWVDGAQPDGSPPPLGELLVQRGLITRAQLDQALAAQTETKQPLGQIIVMLGFATGPTIAQALATQHGRIFKSEYGFATGFDTVLGSPDAELPPVTARSGDKLTLVPAPVDPAPPSPQEHTGEAAAHAAAEAQPSPPSNERDTALERAEERVADLANQLAEAAKRMVDAEVARDETVEKTAALAELETERDILKERLEHERSETQRQLAEARQQLAAAHADRDAARDRNAALEAAADEKERAIEALTAECAHLSEQRDALDGRATVARQDEAEADARLAAANAERDSAHATIAELEQALAGAQRTVAALEAERARLDDRISTQAQEQTEQMRADDPEHGAALRQLAATEQQLAAAVAERDAARSTISNLGHALTEAMTTRTALEAEHMHLAQRLAAAEHELAASRRSETAEQPTDRGPTACDASHFLFFALPQKGYVLVHREGPAPTIGQAIDLSAHGGPAAAHVVKVERRLHESASVSFACLI